MSTMQIKSLCGLIKGKALTLLFSGISLVLSVNCAALEESGVVEITYGVCGAKESISNLVEAPDSSVFSENNFLSETVFLRYKAEEKIWSLDQGVSDIDKKYTRQAVRIIENNFLSDNLDIECLDFYVKFDFDEKT